MLLIHSVVNLGLFKIMVHLYNNTQLLLILSKFH